MRKHYQLATAGDKNKRKQPTKNIDATEKLPMPAAWNKYAVICRVPSPCKWLSVSASIAPMNSLWQFITVVFACGVHFAPCLSWLVKTLSRNTTISVNDARYNCENIYPNNINDMPQYPTTPHLSPLSSNMNYPPYGNTWHSFYVLYF